MNILARIRSGQARWGRLFLALFAVAWLNVILQPCALAISENSAGCRGSSAGQNHDQMSHETASAHGHSMAGDHEMDHGGQQAHDADADCDCKDCGGYLADCAHLDSIKKNDRDKQLSPESRDAWFAAPVTDYAQMPPLRPPLFSNACDAARLSGAFPPLNVLYCIYLD